MRKSKGEKLIKDMEAYRGKKKERSTKKKRKKERKKKTRKKRKNIHWFRTHELIASTYYVT